MKKCLFISAHFPSYKAKYAGHKTAYKILKDYTKIYDKIDLLISCNKDEIDEDIFKEIPNVSLKLVLPLTKKTKFLNILKSKKLFPIKVMSRFSRKILKFLENNINTYNTIHFEFSHSAYPLLFCNSNLLKGKNIVISCHDILVQSSLRKKFSLFNAFDTTFTFHYEKTIFSKATKVIVQSEKDKSLLSTLYGISAKKIEIIQPYLSEFVYKVRELRERIKPENALLFWGAMDREENVEAIVEFIKRYKTLIEEKKYKLYIVGANPVEEVTKFHDGKTIIVTGFVENPSEYFVKAKYGIVPLIRGAGIKVKTLEMLEAGLKVISTPIGAEGVEHENLMVVDLDEFDHWL